MKGYEPGTVCVVTWVGSSAVFTRLGDILICRQGTYVGDNDVHPEAKGLLHQRVEHSQSALPTRGFPVAWMRPLSDPDTQLTEQREEQCESA